MAFTNFIPEVWSARLLEHLDNVHVYSALLNRDYEGDIRAYGDTVHINQIGDIAINDYTGEDLAAPEELDSTMMELRIDQAKYFNFQVKDIDNAQSNPKVVDAAMQRASYNINDVIDNYLAGLLLAGVKSESTITAQTLTSANAYDYLVDLGVLLNEHNVPMLGRWVVIPPWFHGLLLKDERFVGNGTGYNQAILQGGWVGDAAGFRIHLSNNVPESAGSYSVIAGTNAAGSFAEQLVELEAYRLEKNFSDGLKGLHVYGAKVTQPDGLAVLKCTKAAA
ncbi:MAG: P22 phage major capsid protein family protein [Oscillospiraceae bacterium]|nr:P22 phage major capsid protein family protein [Eubacteriales bacterium]MDY2617958.1 P22 phage major capsid protein family protein [Oscillospiraceae bacterium]